MRRSVGGAGAEFDLLVEASNGRREEPSPRLLRTCAATLSHEPESLHRLRGWIRAVIAHTPHAPCLETLVIAANELATNALLHSRSGQPGGSFGVALTWNQETIQIAVQDQGGLGEPCLKSPLQATESGRGLYLVDSLAAQWGWTPNVFGTLVWVQFDAKCPEYDLKDLYLPDGII